MSLSVQTNPRRLPQSGTGRPSWSCTTSPSPGRTDQESVNDVAVKPALCPDGMRYLAVGQVSLVVPRTNCLHAISGTHVGGFTGTHTVDATLPRGAKDPPTGSTGQPEEHKRQRKPLNLRGSTLKRNPDLRLQRSEVIKSLKTPNPHNSTGFHEN